MYKLRDNLAKFLRRNLGSNLLVVLAQVAEFSLNDYFIKFHGLKFIGIQRVRYNNTKVSYCLKVDFDLYLNKMAIAARS